MLFDSCFPHIVNLACKAALAAITDLKYVDDTIKDYSDYDPSDTYTKDCIATSRSLVNSVYSVALLLSIFTNNINRFEIVASRNISFQNM